MRDFANESEICPVSAAVSAIGGKWKITILWNLREGKLRFGELHRKFRTNISPAVLTTQLRELELDGLISREIFKEIPPKVEYSLTEVGMAFIPVIMNMKEWSKKFLL